eukprot:712138_1
MSEQPPIAISIDVQSVATGLKCSDRSPAFICLADAAGKIELCQVFQPLDGRAVVSAIEPYTGLAKSDFAEAPKWAEVKSKVQAALDRSTAVVFQNSLQAMDPIFDQLGLQISKPKISLVERFKDTNRPGCKWPYQYFTLDVESEALLGKQVIECAVDKRAATGRAVSCALLHALPRTAGHSGQCRAKYQMAPASFAVQNPRFEGVCMGHIRSGRHGSACACGARTRGKRRW